MSTAWFQRRAGELTSQSEDDEHMTLIGSLATSDWVRLPPVLGGRQLRVTGRHAAACPKCQAPQRLHLELEDGYGVAECSPCGYVWYQVAK